MPVLQSLWRYPVKAMAGEEQESADITPKGLLGDRAYALIDMQANKVATAKRTREWADLLKCQAQFVTPPRAGEPLPAVRVTLPDGAVLISDQAGFSERLSAALNRTAKFTSVVPDGLILEFAAGTLGGKYATTTEVPIGGAA